MVDVTPASYAAVGGEVDNLSKPAPMTELVRRTRLFLGSYALLFLILALRFSSGGLQIACAVIAATGFLDMAWIVYGVPLRTSADPVKVKEVRDVGPEVSGYLATYLLPFVTVPEPSVRDILAYLTFVLVTGLIYVRSEMTQINPTLYILGRRVMSITTTGGWVGHIVSQSRLEPGNCIRVVPLDGAVRVEIRRRG